MSSTLSEFLDPFTSVSYRPSSSPRFFTYESRIDGLKDVQPLIFKEENAGLGEPHLTPFIKSELQPNYLIHLPFFCFVFLLLLFFYNTCFIYLFFRLFFNSCTKFRLVPLILHGNDMQSLVSKALGLFSQIFSSVLLKMSFSPSIGKIIFSEILLIGWESFRNWAWTIHSYLWKEISVIFKVEETTWYNFDGL